MFTERHIKVLIILGFSIITLMVFLFLWKEPLNYNSPVNKEYFGQFGDFVSGVVGSLWALAGVILFYIALKDQRDDIKINRKALEKQIEALNLQVTEFQLQRTEQINS